jgi:hypothetical protein
MNTETKVPRELLDVKAVAYILNVSPRTIEDWIYRERRTPTPDPLPVRKVGRLNKFRYEDVWAWVERRKVYPPGWHDENRRAS